MKYLEIYVSQLYSLRTRTLEDYQESIGWPFISTMMEKENSLILLDVHRDLTLLIIWINIHLLGYIMTLNCKMQLALSVGITVYFIAYIVVLDLILKCIVNMFSRNTLINDYLVHKFVCSQ